MSKRETFLSQAFMTARWRDVQLQKYQIFGHKTYLFSSWATELASFLIQQKQQPTKELAKINASFNSD